MSRKATITQQEIVNAAFRITQKEGFDKITSRGLAQAAGCSTQPIFRIYESMDALKKDVYEKSAAFYDEYYQNYEKKNDTPFVDLGMAYIGFAKEYPQLFRLLFLTGGQEGARTMYDLVNGKNESVSKEVARAAEQGAQNPDRLFMQMWIFIHGAACMAVTGDNDLDEEESVEMLVACYHDFK